jgi:hypothetical protein
VVPARGHAWLSVGIAAAFAGCVLLHSCVAPRPRGAARDAAAGSTALPALTVASVLAPIEGGGEAELERLRELPDAAAVRLRRAYLWLGSGNQTRALRELNRLLFGEPAPTKSEEAFAHYLRALAYEKQGDHDRAAHDRDAAAQLARDQGLPELAQLAGPAARPEPAGHTTAAAVAALMPRSAWGAAPPVVGRMVPMTAVQRLTIHHSGMLSRSESVAETGELLRSIQKTHVGSNGWGDIGYHYLIDHNGRVWDGRPVEWQGAHAGNDASNRGNIGICLLGNFVHSKGGQSPSGPQLLALQQLVARLCARFRVPPDQILTHRELKATTCPGARLQVAVEELRASLVAATAPAPLASSQD